MSEARERENGRDEDWEVVDDVKVRRPPGMVLRVRFSPASVDSVLAAAETSGLNLAEFARRAVLLVANDRALQKQLAPTETRASDC